MINVLSVASECAPLVKTGGLADVVGALPAAVAAEGISMKTLLPGYPAVMAALRTPATVLEDPDLFGAALNKALNLAADNPVIIASMTSEFGLLGIILNKFGNKP